MTRVPRLLHFTHGALLACALGTLACSGEGASAPPGAGGGGRGRGGRGGDPTVPVTVAQVVQKSMPIEIRVIGSVEA